MHLSVVEFGQEPRIIQLWESIPFLFTLKLLDEVVTAHCYHPLKGSQEVS